MKSFFLSFLRAIFSRYMLALVALIVGALIIWFLGPLLSFGGLYPFGSAVMRIATIVLLLTLLLFLLLRWSTIVIGVIAICFVVWYAGPLLALGELQPFAPVWVRVLIISAILFCYAIYGLYRLWQALRADDTLLKRLLNPGKDSAQNIAKEEIKTLGGIVREGIQQLRRMRPEDGGRINLGVIQRIFESERYLYELPWYMIIGVPGSGKTTVLLNSGCKFPIADQMGAASAKIALTSNAGTVNTQWWFTNEAVLIDTAGRYTAQDDGASVSASGSAQSEPSASGGSLQKNAAEWLGYLGLLRKYRPRAPINGALLTLDVADLIRQSPVERTLQAATLRARLSELRQELGIRFPVYVLVTKCDLLPGFIDYFSSLTGDGRSQVWGFTLPWINQEDQEQKNESTEKRNKQNSKVKFAGSIETGDSSQEISPLSQTLTEELAALQQRLEDGLPMRLQEEVFFDSRFDATEHTHSLRGVYFSSAVQDGSLLTAEPNTLVARLKRALHDRGEDRKYPRSQGQRSYFIHDLLLRVVFPESHLVHPSLGWEWRFRMLRLVGYILITVLFVWFAAALSVSYKNNREYLQDTGKKAITLLDYMKLLSDRFRIDNIPETLTVTRALPLHQGLDLEDPASTYRYGLYAAPSIIEASAETYAHLQDQMLLPQVIRRMENVLALSVVNQNEKTAYETLRVYLMLHSKDHFQAEDVRNWVLQDWQSAEGAKAFGTTTTMLEHLEALFSGSRIVQSASVSNEGLVKRVRAFLEANPSSLRLYERIKATLHYEAPPDFTLLSVIGPQAGTVFTRASGLSLEQGVPGLYTYEGYHDLFSKRLPELVVTAQQVDAWVMGKEGSGGILGQGRALDATGRLLSIGPLMEDIRRQYLSEYAEYWAAFLEDIRPVTGTTLAFDLTVIQRFAAPDSPLARLARSALRETTLSRSLQAIPESEKSYFDKATEQLDKKASQIKKNLALRPEVRLEKQLVDSRFAALREIVMGQPDPDGGYGGANFSNLGSGGLRSLTALADPGAQTGGGGYGGARLTLESITGLINEFYTALVIVETSIAANSPPPAGGDPSARMKLEAVKLPAPFKEVLLGLARSGSEKVTQSMSDVLKEQAQFQLDRLLGLMTLQVADPCRRSIAGRYPFTGMMRTSGITQEVNVEDFNALFAAGGIADEYFSKHLSPYVNTSVRPWRYKQPGSAVISAGESAGSEIEIQVGSNPTLSSELLKLLALHGPDPEFFAQIAQIRAMFFRGAGANTMALNMHIRVHELDPGINELIINIDGQGYRYIHGPEQAVPINWPGPRGGVIAELTALPRVRSSTSMISANGPWALLHLMDQGHVIDSATPDRVAVEFMFEGRRAVLDINTAGSMNPFTSDLFRNFKCPWHV